MEIGLVKKIDIENELSQSYLDYAMSVIVSRALPDARDGMKPVQRRILYSMYDMGIRPESSYKKSARIVGEVLGKYHPHGDQAVYEAMARMAQDFSMRYSLVDGQGNFGSVDGDPPAAMRYTEARLHNFAMEMLSQIERNTVNFSRNFDDTLDEPQVLPAAAPNLLVNGASGIAVGMATNIPPHNLGEVVDAMNYLLENWERMEEVTVDDLMRFVHGPDFPTGGIILQESDSNELVTAYATGKGRLTVRGRVQVEDLGRGRDRIIITELPYMTNKAALIERIAELVREGHLEGISDLRDESDRHGMRVVIELSKTAETDHVLRELYKRTPMQTTFGINMLALVEGEPRMLTLKQALRVYLEHRQVVVKRRSEYDLEKARARAHILEGLRIAINNIDEIIALIRSAPDTETARTRLIKRFKLSEIQANAILDLPLKRLAALERKKIETEYKEVIQVIKELEALLRSQKKIREVVRQELAGLREKYADRRRTQIVSLKEGESGRALLTSNALTPAKTIWVGVTEDGLISKTHGEELPDQESVPNMRFLIRVSSHHTLYLLGESGRAAAVAVEALPEAARFSEGAVIAKVAPLDNEPLAAIFSIPSRTGESDERYVITLSNQGLIKKSATRDLPGPSAQAFILTKVNTDDRLVRAFLTDGKGDILVSTAQGMCIRFSEEDVRPMGLVAAGVNAIKLSGDDRVVGGDIVLPGMQVLLVSSDGAAWRMPVEEFPRQGRYGQGVKTCKVKMGSVLIGAAAGRKQQPLLLTYQAIGSRSARIQDAVECKRGASGKAILALKDNLKGLAVVWDCLGWWEGTPLGEEKSVHKPKAGGTEENKPKVREKKVQPQKPSTPAKKKLASSGGKKPAGEEKKAGKVTSTPAVKALEAGKPGAPTGRTTKTAGNQPAEKGSRKESSAGASVKKPPEKLVEKAASGKSLEIPSKTRKSPEPPSAPVLKAKKVAVPEKKTAAVPLPDKKQVVKKKNTPQDKAPAEKASQKAGKKPQPVQQISLLPEPEKITHPPKNDLTGADKKKKPK